MHATSRHALCATLLSASGAHAQVLVSAFNASTEGWTIETRTNPAGTFALVGTFTPDFVASGGDPGGHISEVDPDNNWSFFRAPPSWHGDRSLFFQNGRVLRYSTRTDANTFPDGRLVIMVGAGGQMISTDAGVPPLNAWTRRTLDLSEDWFLGATGSGTGADGSDIVAVLSDLEALYIGMEFGADLAEEDVDLDSVHFGACQADLAAPFGQLDFSDVVAFLTAFGAMNPTADLAFPTGVFDFSDVVVFLTSFTNCDP